MILIVCPNLAIDETISLEGLELGEIHRSKSVQRLPGAKGVNVARVLSTLGIPCVLTGFVGGHAGEVIQSGLSKEQIVFDGCSIRGESRTCHILVDETNSTQTVVNEPGPEISNDEVCQLSAAVQRLMTEADKVVYSGSLPPGVPETYYAESISAARSKGKRSLLDCSGSALDYGTKALPFLVKINHEEAALLLGQPILSRIDAVQAARYLIAEGISLVMVTLGAEGAIFASSLEQVLLQPPKIAARNSVGSGDAVLAGLAAGLHSGLDMEELGKLAMASGVANALHGGGRCTVDEIAMFRRQIVSRRVDPSGSMNLA